MQVELGEAAIGMRVDRALVQALAEQGHAVTRSQLERAFEAGEVRTPAGPLKPGRVLEGPLVVEVALPRPIVLAAAEPEAIPLAVAYEDELVLVVDKPAGMPVHAGPGHPRGTLVNAVLHHLGVPASALPVLPGNDAARPGLVHRLDKDTSGLVVLAKTGAAQAALARQFQVHTVDRRYRGIVLGEPQVDDGRLDTPHARDPGDRRRFAPTPRADGRPGRRAITRYRVHERLRGAAVLSFELETGRTHQIRMHARQLGHPIYGDDLYGAAPRDPERKALWLGLGRHALHAERLGFDHPGDGQRRRFTSTWPDALRELARALGGTVTA